MLKYTFKLLLVLISLSSFAQEKALPKRQFFIRAGFDLSRLALPYVNDIPVNGFEFSLDTEIKYKFFPTFEAGYNKVDNITETYNDEGESTYAHQYKAEGTYWRLGLNYNMLKYKHRLDRNIFYIGVRYGNSSFSQEAPNIELVNEWGTYETSVPKTNLTAHWAEFIMGLRGEIFTNFYMGYAIRIKTLISQTDDQGFTPYYIPGFGKGFKNIHPGMSYSVFYAIPMKNPKLYFKRKANKKLKLK